MFDSSHADLINELVAVPLPGSEGRVEALVVARDITEARQREQQLAAAKERLSSLFEEAPFGVIV